MGIEYDSINWHKVKQFIIFNQIQLKKYQRGGSLTFIHFLLIILWLTPALFFAILFRVISPWIIIRIRPLYHQRIGHFALNTEIYLCEQKLGIHGSINKYKDIWYYNDGYTSNQQLKRMWNRILKIWPSDLSFLIYKINFRLPDNSIYIIPWGEALYQGRDVNHAMEKIPPQLSFTDEEECYGKKMLESLGIPKGALFICFGARDNQYANVFFPNIDQLTYLQDYRNSDVSNYLVAAEEMVKRGYYLIRMGSVVEKVLGSNNPRIIDYSTNGFRNDFMDIYLGAKCHFFIGSGTGITSVPWIFRKPILFVNYATLNWVCDFCKNHLFIPKKYWLNKEQRFMSFREIFESGAGGFLSTAQYIDKGITLIENTPEEILKVTIEMEERLHGTWITTEEDEYLQKKFWSYYIPCEFHDRINSRIGADFLRKNQELLD